MTTTTEAPTVLIPKGGGYYWIDEIGGKKVQLSKKEIAAGRYVVVDPAQLSDDDDDEPDLALEGEQPDLADELALVKAKLREALKRSDELAAELEETKPTRDVRPFLFETADEVREHYGEKHLRDLAQAEMASINRVRMKQGYDRVTYTPEEAAQALEEVIEGLLADRRNKAREEGPLMRTLKMFAPDGSLRQIPYEGQVNNIAGSLEDGYRKYTKKGFKRTEPMLCPSQDCWEFSAVGADGSMLFTGYCSDDHYSRTEAGAGAAEVPGVTTRTRRSGR